MPKAITATLVCEEGGESSAEEWRVAKEAGRKESRGFSRNGRIQAAARLDWGCWTLYEENKYLNCISVIVPSQYEREEKKSPTNTLG